MRSLRSERDFPLNNYIILKVIGWGSSGRFGALTALL